MRLKKFLLFISLVPVFLNPLFAGGTKESVPGSNSTVTSSLIDISGSKKILYAYIAEGKIYVNFYEQKTEKKTDSRSNIFYEKNQSPEFITDISGSELKIQLIKNALIVYDKPNIYQYTISTENTGEENSIKIDSQSISTKANACLLYDNNCFFVENDGTVGFYNDAEDDKKIIFPDIKINQNNIAFMIIKKDIFLKTISPLSNDWFKNITLENILAGDFTMTLSDKDNLRRHLMINRKEAQSEKVYNNIDDWLSYLKDTYNEIKNKKGNIENEMTALKDEFDNQLLDFDKDENIESATAFRYGGTDDDINYLTGFYNKIIEVYARLKEKNILFPDSQNLLRENYNSIKKELSTLITNKRKNYEKNINSLNAQLAQLDKDREDTFQKSLGMIDTDSIPANDNFDFIFLKDTNRHSDYVIIYKVLMRPSQVSEFHSIGQNTGNIGILDGNFYVCDKGGVSLYNPFTLELKTSPGNKIDSEGRETILYSIKANDNLVVTKTEMEKKVFYRVRELSLDRSTIVLKDPKIKIISNKSSRLTKWADPFYSAIIGDENDKVLYINEGKNKFGEKVIIKKDYIYLETPSGSGIIEFPNVITQKETKE
jgi:hypothetical protein